MSAVTDLLIQAAAKLSRACARLRFEAPVAHVYNPLEYAWESHALYIERYATGSRSVLFLGMNPGPFGMMQTGVPFGEIAAVRDWLRVVAPVRPPKSVHPRRPIEGFACTRSEVSGRRLWGLFAARFGTADRFFADHFVVNYCPLAFLDEGGRNLTPDKFSGEAARKLYTACDEHLRAIVATLRPSWVIGVGDFAWRRAEAALAEASPAGARRLGKVLHPSPASPAANRDWAGAATRQLVALGVWR